MHHVSALLVSLAAVFVSSCNFPPQQLAAHIWTTFFSNCFISPRKWPMILYYQTTCKKGCQFSSKEWAPLIFSCIRGVSCDGPGSIWLSCLQKICTESKNEVFYGKNWKTHVALKWSNRWLQTVQCYMRGKNWEETASCNRIISIVHQSCHL